MNSNALAKGLFSNKGQRTVNEDSLGDPEAQLDAVLRDQMMTQKGVLYAVADGMGGEGMGRQASQTAIDTLYSTYYKDPDADIRRSLWNAVQSANQTVRQQKAGNPMLSRMGSTLTAGVVYGHELYLAHVGDSRAYLIRGGGIQLLTQDHTWVAEAVAHGTITPEEARDHPRRHMITRAIGAEAQVQVDQFHLTLQEGDRLLLCSDGLTNLVADGELLRFVEQYAPPHAIADGHLHAAAEALVALANQRGGHDNITVALVGVPILTPTGVVPSPAIIAPAALASGPEQTLPLGTAAPDTGRPRWRGIVAPVVVALGTLIGIAALTTFFKTAVDDPRNAAQATSVAAKATAEKAAILVAQGEMDRLTATVIAATATRAAVAATGTAISVVATQTADAAATTRLKLDERLTADAARTAAAAKPPSTPPTPQPQLPVGANSITLLEPKQGEVVTECVEFKWRPAGRQLEPGPEYQLFICRAEVVGQPCLLDQASKTTEETATSLDPDKPAEVDNNPRLKGQTNVFFWRVAAKGSPQLSSPPRSFVWNGGNCGGDAGEEGKNEEHKRPTSASGNIVP